MFADPCFTNPLRICRVAVMWTLCLAVLPGHGAEIESAQVEVVDGRYQVDFVVVLAGDVAEVMDVVTNYPLFPEISPSITGVRVIRGRSGADARIEITLRPCVLVLFCKTITKVSDASVAAEGARVEFDAVPELSDFHEARERIDVSGESTGDSPRARFTYSAVLRPGFYVPPFVGPWLIRRAIIRDLTESSRRVERMLQHEALQND